MCIEIKKILKEPDKQKGECDQKNQGTHGNEAPKKGQDHNPNAHTEIENQKNQPNQMIEKMIIPSEKCIKRLIRKLIWKKTGKIVGYMLLMILFLAISLMLIGTLICLHTRLMTLSEVPFVLLFCVFIFVFFVTIVWLTIKMSTIIQQYQTAINRLVILQTRLELGTKEHANEALISQELKMIMRILGKYWDAHSLYVR